MVLVDLLLLAPVFVLHDIPRRQHLSNGVFDLVIFQHLILGARLHVYENSRYVLGYIKSVLPCIPPEPVRWVSTFKLNEIVHYRSFNSTINTSVSQHLYHYVDVHCTLKLKSQANPRLRATISAPINPRQVPGWIRRSTIPA
jgi:hypothetical protein